jgi:hypothetical protein
MTTDTKENKNKSVKLCPCLIKRNEREYSILNLNTKGKCVVNLTSHSLYSRERDPGIRLVWGWGGLWTNVEAVTMIL